MRIGVRFGGLVGPGDAVLVEEGFAPPAGVEVVVRFRVEGEKKNPVHGVGCVCCTPRGAAVEALRRLFLIRARGSGTAFGRVVVVGSANGEAAVKAAVAGDPVAKARFFLE